MGKISIIDTVLTGCGIVFTITIGISAITIVYEYRKYINFSTPIIKNLTETIENVKAPFIPSIKNSFTPIIKDPLKSYINADTKVQIKTDKWIYNLFLKHIKTINDIGNIAYMFASKDPPPYEYLKE